MKHLKKFNEVLNMGPTKDSFKITMGDVRKTGHNLGSRREGPDSFLTNYGWKEDTILEASYPSNYEWDAKKVQIFELFANRSDIGYAVKIDGELKYLIGIYEPHGCDLNSKRGVITAHGHEEIIKLWLDDGEFEQTHTR